MAEKEMPKAYDPKAVEDGIYEAWEQSGFFSPGKGTTPFSIVMPPPNVTGTLHVGHAVMLAIEDLMIRYHRMKGDRTLWVPGTDHAAIATQTKVEKLLWETRKLKRQDLGREKFLKEVEKFVQQSKDTIHRQIRKMGASCDWSREAYTMDEPRTLAVRTAFKKMYNDGLIYRGYRIVNWCPRCQSTLADDEVEYREAKTPFYYFKYGPVVIGTARPETKFADKTIVVHPKDPRYKKLHGKTFDVEWIEGKVKANIITDETIDREFGTGAMTITPAHDFHDFELAQKFKLSVVPIIDEQGNLTDAGGSFAGKNARQSRGAIVAQLKKKGLVEKIDENYTHNLSVCYRCETPLEPLPKLQWFIDVSKKFKRGGKSVSLKMLMLDAVRSKKINIIPERFVKTYFHWIDNLRDWNISRQIWFGHQVPVWYCGDPDMKRMGFAGDIVAQVFDGKVSTWRLRDHGFNFGDVVAFEDSSTKKIFGYGIMTAVGRTTVKEIDLKDQKHWKTYDSHAELIAAFKRHNPTKEVGLNTPVWTYTYTFDNKLKRGACGAIIVSVDAPTACPSCHGTKLQQDPDTLDTWFSSGLWTFSALGWPSKTSDLKTFHPTSVLETGYDILFFWIARMVLMTSCLLDEVPFKTVYLHGLVRDEQGRKMSKSLGNIIDPLDVAEKFGTDAVRLSLVLGSAPGADSRLSEEKIAGFRNFTNKLWNISRFVLSNVGGNLKVSVTPKPQTLADRWILARFNETARSVTAKIERFEFSSAGEELRDFTWNEFADWYLEISKLQKSESVLLHVLDGLLRLWHPFMPFVTEAVWERLSFLRVKRNNPDFLMIQSWPKALQINDGGKILSEFNAFKQPVELIRKVRSEYFIAKNKKISVIVYPNFDIKQKSDHLTLERMPVTAENENWAWVERLSGTSIEFRQSKWQDLKKPEWKEKLQRYEIRMTNKFDIYIDVARAIDINKKRLRLSVEADEQREYVERLEKKLANGEFVAKAPPAVVAAEKEKLSHAREELQKLEAQLKVL